MLSFYPFSLFFLLSLLLYLWGSYNLSTSYSFSRSVCVSLCCSRSFSLSHSCRVLGITLSLYLAFSSQSYIVLSFYPSIHLLFSVSHASGVHTHLLFCVHFIYLSFWITLRVRCCVTMFLCYFKGRILMLHLLYFLVSRKIVSMILIYPTNVNQWWLTLVGPPLYIKI